MDFDHANQKSIMLNGAEIVGNMLMNLILVGNIVSTNGCE